MTSGPKDLNAPRCRLPRRGELHFHWFRNQVQLRITLILMTGNASLWAGIRHDVSGKYAKDSLSFLYVCTALSPGEKLSLLTRASEATEEAANDELGGKGDKSPDARLGALQSFQVREMLSSNPL